MTDIYHRIGVRSTSTNDVYSALTTIDGLSGWWTNDTHGDPGLGGKVEFRFPQGGFDMEVIELEPGELVRWRVVDGPAVPQRRFHGRALQPRRLGRAGRVPVPLQHQVGGVPPQPQGPHRDRIRIPRPGRRRDQRLALSSRDTPGAARAAPGSAASSGPG
jgi:hypothetical protein